MAITPLLVWKNADSTRDLNAAWRVANKGVYEGGLLSFSSSNMQVTVSPFVAKSADGMTCVSDLNETVTLTSAGTTSIQYIVLFLKYEIPTPIARVEVVSEATWLTSINKDYFVTLARVTVPASETIASNCTVRYETGEYTDKLGKSQWRSSVTNFASLPLVGNRNGDARVVLDTMTIYTWNPATQVWDAYGAGTNLTEITARVVNMGGQFERLAISTSGLIGGVLDNSTDHIGNTSHPGLDVKFVEQGAPNALGIGAVHAYVHGHFVKQRAQVLALPTAPVVGDRWDFVFIEVWQEVIPTAANHDYQNNAGGFQPLVDVIAHLNTASEADLGPNFTIESIDLIDSNTVVLTKSALRIQSNISNASTSDPWVAMAATTNQSGNLYTRLSSSDDFCAIASAPSFYSANTWALPLVVLKRSSTEGNFTVFDPTTGERRVWMVSPNATTGRALSQLLHKEAFETTLHTEQNARGGWLQMGEFEVFPGEFNVGPSTLKMFGDKGALPLFEGVLPAPPTSGARRDLVYYEMEFTWNANHVDAVPVTAPRLCLAASGGAHQYSWHGRYRVVSVASAVDEADAMAAAGFTAFNGSSAANSGLWVRTASPTNVTLDNYVYALPVALIHRRNTTAWTVSANPNGSVSRPDGAGDATLPLLDREVVDLRHKIVKRSDLPGIVEKSFDMVLDGSLKTRMRLHPQAANVYGTSAMVHTLTSAAPVSGKHVIEPVPAANTPYSVWGDGDELVCIPWTITDATVNQASADGVYTWTVLGGSGDNARLDINAPADMSILLGSGNVALGPYAYQVTSASAVNVSPTMSSSFAREITPGGAHLSAPQINGSGNLLLSVSGVSASGDRIYSADLTSTDWFSSTPAGSTLQIAVWFRRLAKVGASVNDALFGSPTRVYSITHGSETVHHGPITARVPIVATGTSVFVTQADVYAARPDIASSASSVKIFGASKFRIIGQYYGYEGISRIQLDNGAASPGFERMEIVLYGALAANTEVEVEVMCSGDLFQRWVEVTPETRRIRGLYSWGAATGTYINSGERGFENRWVAKSSTSSAPDYTRGASLNDVSIDMELGGAMHGVVCQSNKVRAHLSQVDWYLAHTSATDHVIWFDPSYTTSAFGAERTYLPGLLYPTSMAGASDPIGSDATELNMTLQSHAPHAPHAYLGFMLSNNGFVSQAPLTMIGVVEDAPTLPLEIIYETPAYQGYGTDTELRARLRGELAHIGDVLVTTEGPNTSPLPTAMAGLPPSCLFPSGNLSTMPFGLAGSTYRPTSLIAVDSPGSLTRGTVVSQAVKRMRNRVSLTRQIPMPPTSMSQTGNTILPWQMYQSAVSDRPMVRGKILSLAGSAFTTSTWPSAVADFASRTRGMDLTIGATTQGAYHALFDLPTGSVILGATVFAYRTVASPSGTLTIGLYTSSRAGANTAGTQLGAYSQSSNSVGDITARITPVLAPNCMWNVEYQNLNNAGSYSLYIAGHPESLKIISVEIEYMEWVDPVNRYMRRAAPIIPTTGYEEMFRAQQASNPKSSFRKPVVGTATSRLLGRVIDIPESWDVSMDNLMTAASFFNGYTDYTGDWVRGRTAIIGGSMTDENLFAYVPFSGSYIRGHESAVGVPDYDADMPEPGPEDRFPVNLGSASRSELIEVTTPFSAYIELKPHVLSATPYAMISEGGDVVLGISTGSGIDVLPAGNVSNYFSSHQNTKYVPVGGGTIDAFAPLGRPVVED